MAIAQIFPGIYRMGVALVALQFGLLSLLMLLAGSRIVTGSGSIPLAALLLAAASVVLAIWTLGHNRLGNFNIRPTPKAGATMVRSGPYRWIRHPMYSALLLGAAALAWVSPPSAWLAWLALALTLMAKALLEERWMQRDHPDYAQYMQTTKRFLPWLL